MKLERFIYILNTIESNQYFKIECNAVRVYLHENVAVVFQGEDMELIEWGKSVLKGRFDRPVQEKSSLMRLLRCLEPESEVSGDSKHLEIVSEKYRMIIDEAECRIYDGYRNVATFSRDGIDEIMCLLNC